MAISPNQSKVIQELIAVGIIPKSCRKFELIATAGDAVVFRYEVYAEEEQLQKIADALKRNPAEVNAIRDILFCIPAVNNQAVEVKLD